jgi:hypothetical protein
VIFLFLINLELDVQPQINRQHKAEQEIFKSKEFQKLDKEKLNSLLTSSPPKQNYQHKQEPIIEKVKSPEEIKTLEAKQKGNLFDSKS